MQQLGKLPDDLDGFISNQLHPAGSDKGDQVSLAKHPCQISRKDPGPTSGLWNRTALIRDEACSAENRPILMVFSKHDQFTLSLIRPSPLYLRRFFSLLSREPL
jgi:hypothetical protein